jgi:hypothetical protein
MAQLMTSDHHDKIIAKLIKASTCSIWKGDLNPSKKLCHFAMEEKNLLEFRNSIKFSMNFYRFKLDLARLKLADIPDSRYI